MGSDFGKILRRRHLRSFTVLMNLARRKRKGKAHFSCIVPYLNIGTMPGAPRSTATTSSSNQSTTAGAGSGELRQRKQKIMLRQMQRHDRREQAHLNVMQTTGQAATSDLLRTYCRTVALLLVVGAALLLYAQPRFLFRSNRNRTNNKNNRNESKGAERLPARSVVTLFPPDVDIQASLPRFFNGYGE